VCEREGVSERRLCQEREKQTDKTDRQTDRQTDTPTHAQRGKEKQKGGSTKFTDQVVARALDGKYMPAAVGGYPLSGASVLGPFVAALVPPPTHVELVHRAFSLLVGSAQVLEHASRIWFWRARQGNLKA
jgi:hypothetical protein